MATYSIILFMKYTGFRFFKSIAKVTKFYSIADLQSHIQQSQQIQSVSQFVNKDYWSMFYKFFYFRISLDSMFLCIYLWNLIAISEWK